jgi:glycosyltransferase involved in cell wall biosynthesis
MSADGATVAESVTPGMMSAVSYGLVMCPRMPWPVTSGAQKRTLRLLEAMQSAGVAPHLLTFDGDPDGAAAELEHRGWQVDVLPPPQPTFEQRLRQHLARLPSPYVPGVRARLKALRRSPPAFVQVEHAMTSYYWSDHPSPRSVLSLHNVDSELLRSTAAGRRPLSWEWVRDWNMVQAMRAVERRAASLADAVLCVSDSDAAHFERLGAEVLVVPNGVDDDLLAIPPELPPGECVLFFGQLDYAPNRHGLRCLLEDVWPRLRALRPAARLRTVGPGMPPELERLAVETAGVEVVGVVPDLAVELAGARAVIVPIWQGGGTRLKALEALAAARPVVGTGFGMSGIGFRDGVHGLLANDAAGLGSALARVLEDDALSLQMATEGRRLAEGYRWTTVTAPARELYARLA